MIGSAARISIQGDPADILPPPPRTRATVALRSLAHAMLSVAASGSLMACVMEPTDGLEAEGAAEEHEDGGYDNVMLVGGSPDTVTLYQGFDYTKASQTLSPGVYDLDDFTIDNDTLSSLRVSPGMIVKLYEHVHYRGSTRTARADVANLGSFDNLTSSVAVYGPISEPAGSPYALGEFTDVESLKYMVASNWTLANSSPGSRTTSGSPTATARSPPPAGVAPDRS
jgi:hypothetical protein